LVHVYPDIFNIVARSRGMFGMLVDLFRYEIT